MISETLPSVAVLVLNYNGQKHLCDCFSSLKIQKYPNFQTFLIDNNSSDNSVEYVKTCFPWVNVISFDKNFGFAKAYNKAVSFINADFAVFLNNDTKVDDNWLNQLVKGIVYDKSIAIAGSKICFYDFPNVIQFGGGKISPIGAGIETDRFKKQNEQRSKNNLIGYASGGAMIVRRDIFLSIGGFDNNYFAYDEDSDLCLRAWVFGYKVVYVPTSIVFHKVGASFKQFKATREYLSEKNRIQSMIKNFQNINLIRGLSLSIVYSVLQTSRFMASRQPICILSLIRANYWILNNLPILLSARLYVKVNRKVNDSLLFKQGVLSSIGDSIVALLNYRKKIDA